MVVKELFQLLQVAPAIRAIYAHLLSGLSPAFFDEIAMIIKAERESTTTTTVTKRCIIF